MGFTKIWNTLGRKKIETEGYGYSCKYFEL